MYNPISDSLIGFFMGQLCGPFGALQTEPLVGPGRCSLKMTMPKSRACVASSVDQEFWGVPKLGVPQNAWFIRKIPIKMDDLGAPLFQETLIYVLIQWLHGDPICPKNLFSKGLKLPGSSRIYHLLSICYPTAGDVAKTQGAIDVLRSFQVKIFS